MKKSSILLLLLFLSTGLACSPKPRLQAVRATKTAVESTVTTTSSGTADAEQQAILGFTAVGRVRAIPVRTGDVVKKGQILAELDNKDLEITYQDAEKEMKRAEQLFKASLLSRAGLDDAKRNLEVNRANFEKTIIKAPFDGVITELNLEIGELAQTGATATAKPPIRIVDLKPRIVRGDIDELDLSKVKVGATARIKILASRTKPYTGVVDRVVPFVSTLKEKDRTSEIQFRISETDASIPVGASADIEIITDSRASALALPARTLLGRAQDRYVFRFLKGKLHKTPIKTGIGNYDRMEIAEGLSEGDLVVFPPEALELKDKMKVKIEIQAWP